MNTTKREIVVTPDTEAQIATWGENGVTPHQAIQQIRIRAAREVTTRTEFFKSAIAKVQADANNAMASLEKGHLVGHFGGRVLHSSGVEVELESGKWLGAIDAANQVLTQDELQAAIKEGLGR